MTYFQVAPGEVIESEDMNTVINQSVIVFPNAAARSTAIAVPTEGMTTWIVDIQQQQTFTGGAWRITGGRLPTLKTSSVVAAVNVAETSLSLSGTVEEAFQITPNPTANATMFQVQTPGVYHVTVRLSSVSVNKNHTQAGFGPYSGPAKYGSASYPEGATWTGAFYSAPRRLAVGVDYTAFMTMTQATEVACELTVAYLGI